MLQTKLLKRTGIEKKQLFAARGGSVSDVFHFPAEMANRFEKNRGESSLTLYLKTYQQ